MKKNTGKIVLWTAGGILLSGLLLAAGLFWAMKMGHHDDFDSPYILLKGYDQGTTLVSKAAFTEKFANGQEIFDWLQRNDFFEEKEGEAGHPRFISSDAKTSLTARYPHEAGRILDILQQAQSSRHAFLIKSAQISSELAQRAVEDLKRKDFKKAIDDCRLSIDVFPLDAKPYILLTKLYLMTGQELKMYQTLTLAGRSYPNFNNIVAVIDDQDLDNIPLDEPAANIYLANFPENKKAAISFLFDDGEKNVYVSGLPLFEKYGFKATIPVIAGFVPEKRNDLFWGSWQEWRDAADHGFEIANHSMYHRDSQTLHGRDFDIAIDQAKDVIEQHTGRKVTSFVFPYDSYNDEAMARALRRHEVIRSWEFLQSFYPKTVGITYGGPNFSVETANRLVDISIKRGLWLMANCHGVTTKYGLLSFKSITPSFLEKHLAYIHSKSDDVWVDTFSHVFEYMAARAHTTIEVKNFDVNTIDLILHSNRLRASLPLPLTVIVKTKDTTGVKSVIQNGQALKSWACAADRLCFDAAAYDSDIRVTWGQP
ncbi:MAG: polysaccharide deacetylase family protein [Candidatus Omnitrophica bacterium]|nr:polysaccharide deacetylase family protein [Candidatus Omnitrophota bacterium]MDE2221501.1 polysaccharide deacetylase family protein [Candidatus Omnitrophota bacterium]